MSSATRDVDIDNALKNCAEEPVHIPGLIQSHGAIVAVDNETLRLTHASENLEEVTGIALSDALGSSIYDVFPSGLRHDMVNNLLPTYLNLDTRQIDPFTLNGHALLAGSSQAVGSTIFEFEPADIQSSFTDNAMQQLAFLTQQLHTVHDADTLFAKSVKLLQVFTGYHRIMIYAFDGEGNGTVCAEALAGGLESLLGLNFPAWDIPSQAREIMKRTPFRYIADVDTAPVSVLAAEQDSAPLDMTHSHLRGVSEVHLQYLRNMGTAGSLTLNVVAGDALWGMIALHHETPRLPDQQTREICRNFVRFFGLKLDSILQRERLQRLHRADQLSRELTETAAAGDADIRFNTKLLEGLTDAMRADGAILSKDMQLRTCGLVPPEAGLQALLKLGQTLDEPLHSSALQSQHPELARALGPDIAGLHMTPMRGDSFVAFIRRDRERQVTWAGAPTKDIEGQGANARLRPRGSFETYKETVRGTSTPWQSEDHQVARDVWSILINSERNALIEKTSRQQKILIDELNHRVRNILSLIRSLSRQSQHSADSIEEYVQTLEARIEAVATAHSLAVEQPTAYVSIRDILELEAEAHSVARTRVTITGEDIGLNPEMAPIFALVMHELMTNASKYGALSDERGQVDIQLDLDGEELILSWRESGGPEVHPPTRQGFGTNLLQNAVRNELRGTISQDFAKDGFTAALRLPGDMLSTMRYVGLTSSNQSKRNITQSDGTTAASTRAAQTCLLVEDSFVVSLDTMQVMNAVGFDEVHTAMTISDAREAIALAKPAFAILDVNLSAGQTSFGVARDLKELGVPFVFVTGYGSEGVPADLFPDVQVLKKPLRSASLEQALQALGL
ncbi:HWE histidine kinase domain-containing protein [uncultured Tateyamaria sp.]|uniref:HWE histidine kinase domain-containing protein n=1 Tax=Tateyamaria sp. 1078 TaxID=3417464 RepID=UPI002617A97C|nr:HWE histidine kinase domain-containing protein [uncultured Tateyamaria sp.]